MSLFAIAIIIILGIFLLLVEFLIIPGFTVFGAAGFVFILLGIGSSYYFHNVVTGNITLAGTVLLSFGTMYYIFKRKTWRNMGLKANINSRHEPFKAGSIQEGDFGRTITRLAPVGKAQINDVICEAKSTGGFINENTEVEVIKVLNTQIIVKPKN
ncbi:MAG TPA: NfeD family protein [Bacteroidales bacterium]|nr:NfeD family protein [Bacteroidales bacterium]